MGSIDSAVMPSNDYQRSEVSLIAWLTLDECMDLEDIILSELQKNTDALTDK